MAPYYMNVLNRNAAWKAAGKPGRRTSIRNQQIHPGYVEDYPDPLVKADNGLGNQHYKTFFAALYSWAEPYRPDGYAGRYR